VKSVTVSGLVDLVRAERGGVDPRATHLPPDRMTLDEQRLAAAAAFRIFGDEDDWILGLA
jgi:hypothetical protein